MVELAVLTGPAADRLCLRTAVPAVRFAHRICGGTGGGFAHNRHAGGASAGLGGAVVPFFVGVSVELLSIEAVGGFALLLVADLTVIYRIWIAPARRS